VGEAEIANIGDQLFGELTVGEIAPALGEPPPPRSEMNFVDRKSAPSRAATAERRSATHCLQTIVAKFVEIDAVPAGRSAQKARDQL